MKTVTIQHVAGKREINLSHVVFYGETVRLEYLNTPGLLKPGTTPVFQVYDRYNRLLVESEVLKLDAQTNKWEGLLVLDEWLLFLVFALRPAEHMETLYGELHCSASGLVVGKGEATVGNNSKAVQEKLKVLTENTENGMTQQQVEAIVNAHNENTGPDTHEKMEVAIPAVADSDAPPERGEETSEPTVAVHPWRQWVTKATSFMWWVKAQLATFGKVKTVNNTTPDSNGNVVLTIPAAPTDETLGVNLADEAVPTEPAMPTGVLSLRTALQYLRNGLKWVKNKISYLPNTPPTLKGSLLLRQDDTFGPSWQQWENIIPHALFGFNMVSATSSQTIYIGSLSSNHVVTVSSPSTITINCSSLVTPRVVRINAIAEVTLAYSSGYGSVIGNKPTTVLAGHTALLRFTEFQSAGQLVYVEVLHNGTI